jgi:Flp pilus assembly protein TadG
MIKNSVSNVLRALLDRNGQALYYAIFGLIPVLGMAGLTVDVGHAYIIQAALQNGTNAAALAAAGAAITGQTQQAAADLFGSYTGEANAIPYVTAAPVVQAKCLNMLMPLGTTCGTGSASNAVKVTQTATVPTYFLNVLNILPFNCPSCSALTVQAHAYAANAGPALPFNIALIVDSTGSMADTDSSCGATEQQCALQGLQLLFSGMNPCPSPMLTCTNSQAALHVALFSFPALYMNALPIATQCSGTATVNSYAPHTLPKIGLTSYHPDTDLKYQYTVGTTVTTWTASYEVTYVAGAGQNDQPDTNGFVSDYFANNAATGDMNPSSSLVEAIGYGANGVNNATTSKVGCLPIAPNSVNLNGFTPNPGSGPGSTTVVNTTGVGEGVTYYAPVIYAAQAALTAEAQLYPTAQNMMIILGDGQMNTQWIYFPQGTVAPGNIVAPSTVVAYATDCSSYATTARNPATNTCGFSYTNSTPKLTALAAASIKPVTATSPEAEATGAVDGKYPDFLDECQQSISAAEYAAAQPTKTQIISIAYGVSDKGCISYQENGTDDFTDVTIIPLYGTPTVPFTISTLSPCIVMENLAQNPSGTFYNPTGTGSNADNFFSDTTPSGSSASCTSSFNPIAGSNSNTLQSIFGLIKPRMQAARLLPNDAA